MAERRPSAEGKRVPSDANRFGTKRARRESDDRSRRDVDDKHTREDVVDKRVRGGKRARDDKREDIDGKDSQDTRSRKDIDGKDSQGTRSRKDLDDEDKSGDRACEKDDEEANDEHDEGDKAEGYEGRGYTDESHEELMKLTTSTLASLIEADSVLRDLPTDVTVEEVAAQVALVQGQSISVVVVREDGERLTVVVSQNGSVLELKRAIQRHMTLRLSRAGRASVKVNWRRVWRSYWLSAAGAKLTRDEARLRDVGVTHRAEVRFVKRLDEKQPT